MKCIYNTKNLCFLIQYYRAVLIHFYVSVKLFLTYRQHASWVYKTFSLQTFIVSTIDYTCFSARSFGFYAIIRCQYKMYMIIKFYWNIYSRNSDTVEHSLSTSSIRCKFKIAYHIEFVYSVVCNITHCIYVMYAIRIADPHK